MKEIENINNEKIGIAINDGGLDYFLKDKPVEMCGDIFSEILSRNNVASRFICKGSKKFEVRSLRGYLSDSILLMREEVEVNSRRSRFILQKEGVAAIKGLLIENDRVIQAIGISGLNQRNADNFACEMLKNLAECQIFAEKKSKE